VRTPLLLLALAGCGTSAASDQEAPPVTRETPAREGSELIGTRPPEWTATTWINAPHAPLRLADLRGKVVLVRWFMSSECPYCSATAPALVELDARYRDRGLVVVGMYHHKGKAPLTVDGVRDTAARFGFRFPVAIDDGWADLRAWWLTRDRDFTSASYLVDREGVIRYVHPGGTYAPGDADYRALERAIESLL
jgi:thiol-disulfide isomerase/thioredoxin